MPDRGALYLIPVPIAAESGLRGIPQFNLEVVAGLRHFIAEDAKSARRNLKLFGYPDLSLAEIMLLNEHTSAAEYGALLVPLLDGKNVGLMSDAGCPGIADPGAEIVRLCHRSRITVVPLTGPSAIVAAIMASGFNGQSFAFVGYLPVDKVTRVKRLKELEELSRRTAQAQFFIETPYRNEQLFQAMLGALQKDTMVFVGCGIHTAESMLQARSAGEWAANPPGGLHKVPAVFGIFR